MQILHKHTKTSLRRQATNYYKSTQTNNFIYFCKKKICDNFAESNCKMQNTFVKLLKCVNFVSY